MVNSEQNVQYIERRTARYKNLLMILVMTVVAAVMTLVIIFYSNEIQTSLTGSSVSETEKEIVPLAATGNIDDAVNALLQEIDDEQPLLDEAKNDKSLLLSDGQQISDFSQSVNENEF